MAVANNEMADARQRLSKTLEDNSISDALSVLDKAVGGLIDLAKGKMATEGLNGDQLNSPYGSGPGGGASSPFGSIDASMVLKAAEDILSNENTKNNPKMKRNKIEGGPGKGRQPDFRGYDAGNTSKLFKAGEMDDDMDMSKAEDENEDDDYNDPNDPRNRDLARGFDEQGEGGMGMDKNWSWQKAEESEDDEDGQDDDAEAPRSRRSKDDDDRPWEQENTLYGKGKSWRKAADDADDDAMDDDDADDDDDAPPARRSKSSKRSSARSSAAGSDDDEDGPSGNLPPWLQRKGFGDQDNAGGPPWQQGAQDDDQDDDDDAPPARRSKSSKRSSARSSARSEDAEEDAMKSDGAYGDEGYMARSFRRGDIHKSLVSGRNGERVAEVVEASRELATMVNVFGSYLEQLSKQVDQVRRDQYNTATVLADAVNTVVKSQAALALGLERMAKSATVLAEQGVDPMSKSMGDSRPNPGVVMNGRVLTEGAALRRSNAMVDETGHALVTSGTVESKLTKSLMGSIIQQSVIDGEFSAKDALRWLTETDSPASGPVAVFRQLPAKLQERISRKVEEEN